MNQTGRTASIVAVIVIILAALAYLVWREDNAAPAPTLGASASSTSVTQTASSSAGSVSISSTGTSSAGYTITPITTVSAPTVPNYKTPLTFSSNISAADQAQYESQFASIQTTLASDPTDWPSWIDLGILRQNTGDYQGAAADWTYITEIYPTDPTAYADLANLYATDLNEPTKAIADYKQAITLEPTQQVSYYENLAQVYAGENDSADERAILEQGIDAKVVGYQNLQTMLNAM